MYPCLSFDEKRLSGQISTLAANCLLDGHQLGLVLDDFLGNTDVFTFLSSFFLPLIADSRLKSLEKIRSIAGDQQTLMSLSCCPTDDLSLLVQLSDIVLVSDLNMLQSLQYECLKQQKIIQIVLSAQMFSCADFNVVIHTTLPLLANLKLTGFYLDNDKMLYVIEDQLAPFRVVNSRPMTLYVRGHLPLSSAFPLVFLADILPSNGTISSVVLKAEVVEMNEKPSLPEGNVGLDAFGNVPCFVDKGIRKRAILALGKQDVDISYISPITDGIEILGASSDHLICDVHESDCINVGDVVSFEVCLTALHKMLLSSYVVKLFE
ncbi:hypothetical protein RCL1_006256 [Eukaryota sp. TZLM3-RCL]